MGWQQKIGCYSWCLLYFLLFFLENAPIKGRIFSFDIIQSYPHFFLGDMGGFYLVSFLLYAHYFKVKKQQQRQQQTKQQTKQQKTSYNI